MIPLREAYHRLDEGLLLAWGRKDRAWETRALRQCRGRVLAESIHAVRHEPPCAVSSMDGYGVSPYFRRHQGVYGWTLVGESRAGVPYDVSSPLERGMAVRLYTGAVVPEGSDRVLLQEDAQEKDGMVTCAHVPPKGAYVRQQGSAMKKGDMLLTAPLWLQARHLLLLASLNRATLSVFKKPRIALLATGDELAMLGERDVPSHRVIASTLVGLAASIEAWGGEVVYQGIVRDDRQAFRDVLWDVLLPQVDMIVTTGGASVGRYDVVARVLEEQDEKEACLFFHKVAIRPGKPVRFAVIAGCPLLCLPGNPVSSMVCGLLFLRPMIRRWFGLSGDLSGWRSYPLTRALPEEGTREHYRRGMFVGEGVRAFSSQDSAGLKEFAHADVMIRRQAGAGPARVGDMVDGLPLISDEG
ncbi:MAG: molybdopterin molybdotransferase MoeA [Alphaproteobacteria bacterium GM7ARS4]|nr:molybdopterin molybdotransferase MoeA [Alphaproteobacteria bacterium GM7ARS4]